MASGAGAAPGRGQRAGQVGQQAGDRIAAGHVVVVHQHQLEGLALVDGDEAERLLVRRRHEGPVELAFDGARQQPLRVVARPPARSSSTAAGPPS